MVSTQEQTVERTDRDQALLGPDHDATDRDLVELAHRVDEEPVGLLPLVVGNQVVRLLEVETGSISDRSTNSSMSIVWLAFGASEASSSASTHDSSDPSRFRTPSVCGVGGDFLAGFASDTFLYRMRAPVPSSNWFERDVTAAGRRHEDGREPARARNPTEPLQIALGNVRHLRGPSTLGLRSPERGERTHILRVRPVSRRSESSLRGIDATIRRGRESRGTASALSNLDKVLYADAGFTKGQVIDYYPPHRAPVLLPHLRGPGADARPGARRGGAGQVFFEKTLPRAIARNGMKTALVGKYDRHEGIRGPGLVDTLPALIWVANLAALELHTYQARVDDLTRPNRPRHRPRTPASPRRSSTGPAFAIDLRGHARDASASRRS